MTSTGGPVDRPTPESASAGVELLVVSPLATVRWSAGQIVIGVSGTSLDLAATSAGVLTVLHAFARPRTLAEAARALSDWEPDTLRRCVETLTDGAVLIPYREATRLTGGWDIDSLAFHRVTRSPRLPLRGGEFPPPIAPRRWPETVELSRRPVERSRDFGDVLDRRRSRRSFATEAITFDRFSRFLWLSARNRGPDAVEPVVSRPYPSGGAAYTLELYLMVSERAVESLAAGVYRFRPRSHSLEVVSRHAQDASPFLQSAQSSALAMDEPPVVIVITSRFSRQRASYGQLAYSLVLKEVGGLFQTMYLVGEHLDLATVALGGSTADDWFCQLIQVDEVDEPIVGEFAIGARPAG